MRHRGGKLFLRKNMMNVLIAILMIFSNKLVHVKSLNFLVKLSSIKSALSDRLPPLTEHCLTKDYAKITVYTLAERYANKLVAV